MYNKRWAVAPLLALSVVASADGGHTRGIGKYPGRPTETNIPERHQDAAYHNLALLRTAIASSSVDYNLTAQLVTDGIISSEQPATVQVSTADGVFDLRDKEKTFDGNIHSSVNVMGEDNYLQFDYTGMDVATHELRLNAWAAYRASEATKGYAIRVEASANGIYWYEVGALKGADLPGKAAKQMVSSDPNKQEATERLPLRLVDVTIPVTRGNYRHLRIKFQMPGCAYWRVYESLFTADERGMMPSSHFSSVWMAHAVPPAPPVSFEKKQVLPPGELADRRLTMSPVASFSESQPEASSAQAPATEKASSTPQPQWVYVDLGERCQFDKVTLHWLHRAQAGQLQTSDDAAHWKDVAQLQAGTSLTDSLSCQGTGRYVRLWLTTPDASGVYALSEMQVYGTPVTPHAAATTSVRRLGLAVGHRYELNRNWQLKRDGGNLWLPATVPATVLTSYMNVGAVPDNTFGNQMRQISESYFNADFWYRTQFRLGAKPSGNRVFLNLDGINWKADIYVNGNIQGAVNGAFVRGRFDITPYLTAGTNNIELRVYRNEHIGAVKIKNAESTDLNGGVLGGDNPTFHASVGWDWITSTPGREVGIWNNVYLSVERTAHVSDPMVTTKLGATDTLATMTPCVRVENNLKQTITTTVTGWIGDIRFQQQVTLKPLEVKDVTFSPAAFPQLQRQTMNLWWPNGYGTPYLYDAGFAVAGDTVRYKAGIREMSYADLDTRAAIYVNHKRVTPLGGNWGFSETNLNYRAREYDAAVRYHRDMNFTMIRNWVGQIGDKAFYEACDRYGIMVWQDFWLANPWDGPDPYNEEMFMENARDYIRRIRQHPSIAIYVGRNEGYPPATLDQALRASVAAEHPQLGYISSSADDGVSGHGPYGLRPTEWYFAHQSKQLHSEQGMPNVPNIESLRRMLPADQLWPQNVAWGEHDFTLRGAQNGSLFNDMIARHFGEPQSAEQFAGYAQWVNYDGHRAMYEASQQHRMGLLMWMSHPCWPSMVWQTYDYYLEPTAGYFGLKKACEPLHLQYNPGSKKVEAVNRSGNDAPNLTAAYTLYDVQGRKVKQDAAPLNLPADHTQDVLAVTLPAWTDSTATPSVYFLRLQLTDGDQQITENTYVLGQETDNFKALLALPQVKVECKSHFERQGSEWMGSVTIHNPASTPALMTRLNLKDGDGEQILPVIYSDNYFHLMPGESRTISVSFHNEDVRVGKPQVEVTSLR